MEDAQSASQHGPATAARIDLATSKCSGSGSTMYGIGRHRRRGHIVTRRPEASEFRLRTALGNFGVTQSARLARSRAWGADEQLNFSRDFRPDSRPIAISQSALAR